MEFAHHDNQAKPTQTVSQSPAPSASASRAWTPRYKTDGKFGMWLRCASVALLFSGTVLVVAIAGLLYYGNGSESRYVDSSKYQAVDVNANGSDQLYFGHIVKVNSRFLVLQDIYYAAPGQSAQSSVSASSSFSLIKSGCERVGAYDQMIINRDHVTYWENLQSSGTVAQKIAQDKTAHPNGPDCSAQTSTPTTTRTPTATAPNTTPPTTTTTPSTTTKNSTTTAKP